MVKPCRTTALWLHEYFGTPSGITGGERSVLITSVYGGYGVLLTSTQHMVGWWAQYFEHSPRTMDLSLQALVQRLQRLLKTSLVARPQRLDEIFPELLKVLNVMLL